MFIKCERGVHTNSIWIMQYFVTDSGIVRCRAIKCMENAILDNDYPCMTFFMTYYKHFPGLCEHCVLETLEKIKCTHSERYNQFFTKQVYINIYEKNKGSICAGQVLEDDDEAAADGDPDPDPHADAAAADGDSAPDPDAVADGLLRDGFPSIGDMLDEP